MNKQHRIAIIDYKMSNMFSLKNTLDFLGADSVVTADYRDIESADGVILPGVGAFPEAVKHIANLGLEGSIKDYIGSGKPFMGICLGLQLLFSTSEEYGYTDGLGIIEGTVESFSKHEGIARIPHTGWNRIRKRKNIEPGVVTYDPLKEVSDGEHFYFVHSFYVVPDRESDIYTLTEYSGLEFCSSILRDNLFACQFHPEKSGAKGLHILTGFLARVASNLKHNVSS
jgi:imidazole glycerol-phosphate synthase subunit HisH